LIQDVEVRDAGSRGKGVFALKDFAPGEFIFRRRHGRIVKLEELESLSDEDRMHLCELNWTLFAVLLPPGAYLNHSCERRDPDRLSPERDGWRAVELFVRQRQLPRVRRGGRLLRYGREPATRLSALRAPLYPPGIPTPAP
jgi:hypothetical protein